MKVMLLAYETPEDFALRDDKANFDSYMGAWYAYSNEMSEKGVSSGGAALQPPAAATVLSVRDGERKVQDGPYSDAKEQLGGFFMIDVADMDEAVAWAAKCPAAQTGYVDVRPVPWLEEGENS